MFALRAPSRSLLRDVSLKTVARCAFGHGARLSTPSLSFVLTPLLCMLDCSEAVQIERVLEDGKWTGVSILRLNAPKSLNALTVQVSALFLLVASCLLYNL